MDWQAIGTIAAVVVSIFGAGWKVSHAMGKLEATVRGEIETIKTRVDNVEACQHDDHALLLKHERRLTRVETIKGVNI
jgi:hypothetical protein